jgi:hypothetical protein
VNVMKRVLIILAVVLVGIAAYWFFGWWGVDGYFQR